MPAVMEAIDRMSSDERVKTMEYLWAVMTVTAEPESPAWHGDILAERRRRVAAGEEGFMSVAESKRRLYEEVHALRHGHMPREGRCPMRPYLKRSDKMI
jgi:hypothetical protein